MWPYIKASVCNFRVAEGERSVKYINKDVVLFFPFFIFMNITLVFHCIQIRV